MLGTQLCGQLPGPGYFVAQNGPMESNCVLKDPVCGMTVTDKSFHHLERQGQSYYFCGTKCKNRFANEADRYTGQSPDPSATPDRALQRWMNARWWSAGLLLVVVLVALGVWLQ
jgi:YHS domain-containing protein